MQLPSSPSSEGVLVRPKTCLDDDLAYDRYPTGSRVKVYWPGEKQWYIAAVTSTRTEIHRVRKAQVKCREIYCVYELDGHEQWHSLHNNKVQAADTTGTHIAVTSVLYTVSLARSVCEPLLFSQMDVCAFPMLCASVLAELEAATPIDQRPLPPSDEVESITSSISSSISSGQESNTVSTVSTASLSSPDSVLRVVGAPRDFSGHADGTAKAYDSIEKWVLAALRSLGKKKADLVLPSFEPNDVLCSEVHSTIADWHTSHTTARDAGVVDYRPSALEKPPPQECLVKARGWLLRYINQRRAEQRISSLPERWGRDLACRKADARAVNKEVKKQKAESGKLYHHKHDVAPTQEELMTMTYVGFSGDQRVDADILDSLEGGMAVALYLPTGARGSELKKMHLQSLGHERIQDEKSGVTFECLKLTAFETKTKEQHLNQILAHSNPWRCGVGLLGLSLLMRVKLYGAMPFSMQTNDKSWKIIGTNVDTLDRRIKEVFKVAGVRRQQGDPVTYLGRHFGTRLLQHAGGSAEGGAARRGHSNGTASFHYTECPLPDLLKLAGNDSDKPFTPAHHQVELYPLVDAVLLILFPQLDAHERYLDKRQKEVDAMRGNADKVRTEEQLNDQQRLTRSIRFACRIALCCIVARPRTWKQWSIIDESTVWQRATNENHRVVVTLFAGNKEAIQAMNQLGLAVRRMEEAEIKARATSPERAITTQVVSAIAQMREDAAKREAMVMERLMSMTNGGASLQPLPPPPAEAPPSAPPPPVSVISTATAGARVKHKRESQDEVAHFSSWSSMSDAIEYAAKELAPREKEEGASWRILKREDGREDKSRDKQWRCYRSIAIATGMLVRSGKTFQEALASIQARFESFGAKAHTPLLREINEEIKKIRDGDALAREVLRF
jgi:hypothetical protein